MFKIPTATFVTLSGLVAACLLLIALTGENVSSSMDALPALSLPPGMPNAIPSVPAVPTFLPSQSLQPTSTPALTPTPQATAAPAIESGPPESIPGLVRVTEVPSPTPVPGPTSMPGVVIVTSTPVPAMVPEVNNSTDAMQVTVERSSPSQWLIPGSIALVGVIFVVFGVYRMIRRRR
ncbi:hypothetical protein [Methanocella arvoryzae]|nr:hypothetical protein [Methanocella arvoryzae]